MGAVVGADEAGETLQAPEQTPGEPGTTLQASQPTPQGPGETPKESGETPKEPGGTPKEPGETPKEPGEASGEPGEAAEQMSQAPGFGERGRMRRRARFLRKARELAYRDLGGLVFDLHRFGQRNDPLVLAKLAALRHIDTELRALEESLRDRRPVTVLREVGIAACPRCAAIHGGDDRFCPGCGLEFDTNADRPISTGPIVPPAQISPPASQPTPSPAQISAPASQPADRISPPASQPTPSPAQISAPAQPKVEPGPSVKPKVEPAPPVKPTAPPVAAKPTSPPASGDRPELDRTEEDEPTQILRPPARGT